MNLAQAYVQILPQTEGIKDKLTQALGGDAEEAGAAAGIKSGGGFASALGVAAKAAGAGIAAASAATGALVKSSIDSFSEFEQSIGGLETLFKESAGEVSAAAAAAYKTAGLSANEYMSLAISSAASMVSSLNGDTKEAARLTDMSIIDMSDNVNKMGTSLESLQNAYRGFSRGNFTMLDNLSIGFAGTKEGMQQLLDKAHELSGVEYKIDSYADIVQAIHVVQEEMGITGTTAKEASETISGSIGSLKAAWANVVTGLTDPDADIGLLVSRLAETGKAALEQNLLPAAERTVAGIGRLLTEVGPVIAAELPALTQTILPPLMESIFAVLGSVSEVLPGIALQVILTLANTIIDNLPQILEVGGRIVMTLITGIIGALPELSRKVFDMVLTIAREIMDGRIRIGDAFVTLFEAIWDALPEIITNLTLAAGLLVAALGKIFYDLLGDAAKAALRLGKVFIDGLLGVTADLRAAGGRLVSDLLGSIRSIIPSMPGIGADIIRGLINGILGMAGEAIRAAANVASGIASKIQGFFHIGSPSKLTMGFGRNVSEGLAIGIDAKAQEPVEEAQKMSERVAIATRAGLVGGANPVPPQKTEAGSDGTPEILALLKQYLPQLVTLAVVLDGAQVGSLVSGGVNASLGRESYYQMREALV